jgi:uncharacterized membrane protein
MIAAAVLLAWLALRIEIEIEASAGVWWLNQGSAEEASRLLSALLGSLITMTALVISITMVVLTLAAGQLGPRLIRNFAGDRRTQAVIGVFIGTVVYILLIFRMLDSDLPKDAVPHFAVTMASVLVFLCLILLLYYVHHLSRSIVADTVVDRVGAELDHAIRTNRSGKGTSGCHQARFDELPGLFALSRSGYVETIDFPGLVEAVSGRVSLLQLLVRPGNHVLAGRTHALVWPKAALDDELSAAIAGRIAVGNERTPVQDIEFSVRQLVEVGLRALSPGVNDPFTAIAVINRLSRSLALAMECGGEQRSWRDATGNTCVIAATTSFNRLITLSFDQIRQAAAAHPDVLIRMLDVLAELDEGARNHEQSKPLRRQAEAVMETARLSIRHSTDLEVLENRQEAARANFGGG